MTMLCVNNFGTDINDLSGIYSEDINVYIKKNELKNPFFVGIEGGSLNKLSNDKISEFKKVMVMCLKDSYKTITNDMFKIFTYIIDKNELYSLGKYFALIEGSTRLLKNYHYKNNSCIVDKEHLISMFGEKILYNSQEIVIPLLELDESTTKINISLYDKQSRIENLKDIVNLSLLYNKNNIDIIDNQLSGYFNDIRESQYWNDKKNCNFNMTDKFIKKQFIYKIKKNTDVQLSVTNTSKADNDDINRVINDLTTDNIKKLEYLKFIDKPTLWCLGDTPVSAYKFDEKELVLTKNDITELICSIDDENELYYIFNSLLVSKEYCHMVLNNNKVLEKVSILFKKYGPVYKLLIGYAWICCTLEEQQLSLNNRFIFDIETANKLPVFPYIFTDLAQNPYIQLLVDKKVINIDQNALGLHCLNNLDGYGVCNLNEFKQRLNLFTSNDVHNDIFDGIDWKCFAIFGDVISACLQKKSPLFLCISNNQRDEDKWTDFFKKYYGDSMINIMCNDKSVVGFCEKTSDVIKTIKSHIPDCKNENITMNTNLSTNVSVTKYFFDETVADFNEKFNMEYTVDEMINNFNSNEIKEYLYLTYTIHKSKFNSSVRKNGKNTNECIKQFMNMSTIDEMDIQIIADEIIKNNTVMSDNDICLHVNNFRSDDDKVSDDKNYLVVKISENIKFTITSKSLRTIEISRSSCTDFFSDIGKNQLACTKAYYQNNNVFITPSCITAMMTGINIDYDNFSNSNPVDIINRYRMRGFGTLLSRDEIQHMIYYNNNVDGIFHILSNSAIDIKKSMGPKTDMLLNYSATTCGTIRCLNDLRGYYYLKYYYASESHGIDIFKFKSINDGGSIIPYDMYNWMPNAYIKFVSEDYHMTESLMYLTVSIPEKQQ